MKSTKSKDGQLKLRTQVMGPITRQTKAHTPKSTTFSDALPPQFTDSPINFKEEHEDGTISVNWTPEAEIFLFRAILEHRLVGI